MNTELNHLSMAEVISWIWKGRWVIVVTTVVIAGFVAAASIVLPKKYTAVAIVMPAGNEQGGYGPFSALASRYGSIASLAGVALPTDNVAAEAIATLQSRVLTTAFIQHRGLLPVLFSKQWDETAGRWRNGQPPGSWSAATLFDSIRTVEQDPKSGMIYVRITWRDPGAAAEWANGLVEATNSHLRQREIEQAERNIEYLRTQVEMTTVMELRSAVYSLMEAEIQKAMLARGNDEFALRFIDAAISPELPASPRPILWIVVAIVGGSFLSTLLVLIRASLQNA